MSRWEGLKAEKGDERGRRRDYGRRNNNRWAPRNSNATTTSTTTKHEGSRQHNHKRPSFRGKQQYQRNFVDGKEEEVASTNSGAEKNDQLSTLIEEHDRILNSLKSTLQFRCNKNDDKTLEAIESLSMMLDKTTNLSQLQVSDEIPSNTDVFMGLVALLKSDTEMEQTEASDDLNSSVVQTIVSYLKISNMGGKTNVLLTTGLSKSQVELGITTLSTHYKKWNVRGPQSPMASSLLVATALLTKDHVSELPPESTARHIVGAIFIPYLSESRLNQDRLRSSTTTTLSSLVEMKYVCEATIALLRNPSHASAMLAPLVADVSNFEIEEETMNPLKMELFGVLLKYLETPVTNDTIQTKELESVCNTISAAIDGIRRLKRGNDTDMAAKDDADARIVKALQKFIMDVVAEYNKKIRNSSEMPLSFEHIIVSSLQLLKAMIACYPRTVTGFGWKLIIEGANRNIISSYLPNLLLIDNTHESETNSKHLSLAMDCIADFLTILPWKKWLKHSGSGRNSVRNIVLTPINAPKSGLYNTVVDALVSLIGITKKKFCKCHDGSQMATLGRVMKAIMLEIPYCDIKLIRAGEDLWKEIAKVISDSENHCNSFRKDHQRLACEVFIASCGGTTTPQGELRGMSLPAQSWFLSKSSFTISFLDGLLYSLESIDGRFDQTVNLLSSVLRTLPDIALQRWDAFSKIFQKLNPSSNRKELMLMGALESFMLGRKDFEVLADLKYKNYKIITDIDEIMLQDWSKNTLQRCLNICSAFRREDWVLLDQIDGRVSSHLDNVLSCCHNPGAKIREGAARAVGEFCTQYFFFDFFDRTIIKDAKVQQYRFFVNKVHLAMLKLSCDKNAGARSMSIFSLGNLSDALKGLKPEIVIETSNLYEIHKVILHSFSDTNDKVVKNAIRSVGHTSNLLALFLHRESSDKQLSCGLLAETIQSLTSKLWKTLYVALNEEQKAAMTWKERSVAKKHGWGACHSLGLVFEGLWLSLFEDSNELATACLEAVRCLLRCPCHHDILNEKVVLAAMAAICHLPSRFLSNIESQEAVLGNALKTSILILESGIKNERVATKVTTQNDPFLLHLLNSASIADATIALADDRITAQTLESLYSWMVEVPRLEKLTARAFEVFALALQQPGRWSANVAFEQKFTSRALQKQKKERVGTTTAATNDSNLDREHDTNEDDEADEL